jgi:predicted O-methyltransferase YrrM
MSLDGTATHLAADGLPPLVARALASARDAGFANSCRPAFGRLLSILANGTGDGKIGETGTGCGVGLAWMAGAASPGARLVSVEQDEARAAIAARLFADDPRVTTLAGDWGRLGAHVPFDLLFLDGGGQGKRGTAPIDPAEWLRPGGVLVIDDYTPSDTWPPTYGDGTDESRLHWLTHPRLLATEIRTDRDACAILATRRPG